MRPSREMSRPGPAIFLAAGERSGDQHGAGLARALLRQRPDLRLSGVGGGEMASAGVSLIADYGPLAVVGLTEVLPRIPRILALLRRVSARLRALRPDLYVAIDAPDFNFRLMRRACRAGIPVAYFIAPQVWAWRRGRLRTMARSVNLALVIFPFEQDLLEDAGVPARFIGHPMAEELHPPRDRQAQRAALGWESDRPLVALLPGSRMGEWRRHVPLLRRTAAWVGARRPAIQWGLSVAGALHPPRLEEFERAGIRLHRGAAVRLLEAADAALVASGTASLEAALVETPSVVFYRLAPLTYALARTVVQIPHFAMPNVLAGEELVPEYPQQQATPERLGARLLEILEDPRCAERQRAGFGKIRRLLERPGSYDRAAELIIQRIEEGPQAASAGVGK